VNKLQPEVTNADLKILVAVIETLPAEMQTTLRGAVNQVNTNLNRKKQILQMVNDSISQLRVDVKYLMFDLEATRRERDELRARLGE